jgi:hypothetical protein
MHWHQSLVLICVFNMNVSVEELAVRALIIDEEEHPRKKRK